jgi:hypothetical protein
MSDTAVLPTDRPGSSTRAPRTPAALNLRRRLTSPRVRRFLLWALVPVSLALLAWRRVQLQGGAGLDQSWSAALHMAINTGVGFGNHLVFTYGPLGFLSTPELWYTGTGVVAFCYLLLLRVALAGALFAAARRNYGNFGGYLVALCVASAIDQTLEPIGFLILAVLALERVHTQRDALLVSCVAGAFSGIELLTKESVGIELSALTIVLVAMLPGRRRLPLAAAAVSLLGALVVAWAAAGQSLGALPDYGHNAARIVSGYASAMSFEDSSLAWQYGAAWIVFFLGLGAVLQMATAADSRRRWGLVALWTAFAFLSFKEGFVRHDTGHGIIYFEAILGGLVAFSWRRDRRWSGLGLTAGAFAVALAAHMSPVRALISPYSNASMAVSQIRQVFTPSERAQTIAVARQSVKSTFPIDGGTLALLRGHTVHVAPYDAVVPWAYQLDWRPLPVFQSYSGYTTGLDQLDADTLTSPRAPERILVDASPFIDGRLNWADEPLTTRTLLCRYAELRTTPTWDVLGRTPNRCARPAPLATVRATWGQAVGVPAAPDTHSIVFVRIGGVAVHDWERIEALFYKPTQRLITLQNGIHRLVTGTASDGIVLHAPPGVDLKGSFKIAPESRFISVEKSGQAGVGGGTVTFAFFAQPVTPAAPQPGRGSRGTSAGRRNRRP